LRPGGARGEQDQHLIRLKRSARRCSALRCDGPIAAMAQGVVERGWLGVFTVATLPAFRRRGLASRVLSALGA
jgi:predicted GNAT family acetyltransferase